jgi:DNA-binding NarL/FixJ family response regulator
MAPKQRQKIEIEKTHRDPLLSFNQPVTADCSDFLGTALILDVMMPIKGGFAAAEEIKKALPSIPILLISTGRDEEIVKQSKLAGVQGFISKFDLHSVLLKGTDALLRGETFFEDRDQSE